MLFDIARVCQNKTSHKIVQILLESVSCEHVSSFLMVLATLEEVGLCNCQTRDLSVIEIISR